MCISFHAVLVFGLGKDLLFKSVLGRCVIFIVNWFRLSRRKKNGKNVIVPKSVDFFFLQNLQENSLECVVKSGEKTLKITFFFSGW